MSVNNIEPLAVNSTKQETTAWLRNVLTTILDISLIPKWLKQPTAHLMLPRKHHRTFQTIAQSLGFKGARLHDIRHAHATILLEQGVHPKIVQERLGHSSVLTTLDIYSHIA